MRLSGELHPTGQVVQDGDTKSNDVLPDVSRNREISGAQSSSTLQPTDYDIMIADGWEATHFSETIDYGNVWMEQASFDGLGQDPFQYIGLDWLFAPPQGL